MIMNVNGHVFVLQSLEDLKRREKKDTDFFNCVAFASAAKNICKYAKKGGILAFMSVEENRETTLKKIV